MLPALMPQQVWYMAGGSPVRLVMTLLGLSLGAAHGAEPQTLAEGSWVCATPEAHDEASASEREGQDSQALEAELRARCIRMTSERLADVMAPFVAVADQVGDKARVSFAMEVYERGAKGAEAGIPQPRAASTGRSNIPGGQMPPIYARGEGRAPPAPPSRYSTGPAAIEVPLKSCTCL